MKLELNKIYHLVGLRWDEQWEFDCPAILLSPVLKVYEDGRSIEGVFEDFMIDGASDIDDKKETLPDHEFKDDGTNWRGWNLTTLKRRAREALNGKNFPLKSYEAEETWGKFVINEDDGYADFVECEKP